MIVSKALQNLSISEEKIIPPPNERQLGQLEGFLCSQTNVWLTFFNPGR